MTTKAIKDKLPATKVKPCTFCGKEFTARRKGYGYTSFCPECSQKRVWIT